MTASRSKTLPNVCAMMTAPDFSLGGFELCDINFVGGERNVYEDGDETVLNDWIDRGGESCGHCDHFVPGFQPSVSEFRGSKCTDGDKVGGGAGVHKRSAPNANEPSQFALKILCKAASREPCV